MQQKSVQSRGTGSIEIVETHYMKFTPIDRTIWERNSHYDYYTNLLKCGYSVTVSLVVRKCSSEIQDDSERKQDRITKRNPEYSLYDIP